jgi:anti-sigma regulatory factor (Ser/Thr protein kinase)
MWLGAIDSSPGTARSIADEFLSDIGLGKLAEAAELVVSELVTNAVCASQDLVPDDHPVPPVGLTLSATDERLLIEVWDADPSLPEPRVPVWDDECGRGLMLVDALSSRWGWYSSRVGATVGKATWAEVTATDLPPPIPLRTQAPRLRPWGFVVDRLRSCPPPTAATPNPAQPCTAAA